MRCPGEVYQNSARPYQGTPQELIYPGMVQRRVDKNGYMSWQDQRLFLSGSLAGCSVGLKAAGGEFTEGWFAKLLLGPLDPNNGILLPPDIPHKTVWQGSFDL